MGTNDQEGADEKNIFANQSLIFLKVETPSFYHLFLPANFFDDLIHFDLTDWIWTLGLVHVFALNIAS